MIRTPKWNIREIWVYGTCPVDRWIDIMRTYHFARTQSLVVQRKYTLQWSSKVKTVYTNEDRGRGYLTNFPRTVIFFSASPKSMLVIEYHVHILQVSPQISWGDTWQICMWCQESSRIKILLTGKLTNGALVPHPSGPFYWHGLTLIPAWISNHTHGKV